MDFLNKLGKKTTEAYQSAKEKTSKISEELKLKGKISDYNEKIEGQYIEIGKMVYEKMRVGEDPAREDITPKCEEIERIKEEIDKANVELLALRDIKKCSKCGAELSLDSDFCSKCGEKQPVIEKVEITVAEEQSEEVKNAENAEVTEVSATQEQHEENHEEQHEEHHEENQEDHHE